MTATEGSSSPQSIGILIFEDVEVLDFCGPFEAFSVAQRDGATDEADRLFQVHVIAERAETVRCRNGLMVTPHYTIDDHPGLDILLIPGGRGTRRERTNPRILVWIAEQHSRVSLTTSVCMAEVWPSGPPATWSIDGNPEVLIRERGGRAKADPPPCRPR